MKKWTALILIFALLCGCFSGCAAKGGQQEAYVPTGDAIVLDGQEPDDFVEEEVEPHEVTLAYYPDRPLTPLIGYSQNNRVPVSYTHLTLPTKRLL